MILRRLLILGSSVAAFVFFSMSVPWARASEEPGHFTGRVSGGTTSDGIEQRSIEVGYLSHPRDLFWPYAGEAEEAWDYGIRSELLSGSNSQGSYRGIKALGMVGRKFSPRYHAQLGAGFHQLDRLSDHGSKRYPVLEIEGSMIPLETLQIRARLSQDLLYQELIQPAGVSESLSARSAYLDVTAFPVRRLKASLRSSARAFSDSNFRGATDLGLMAQLPVEPLWVWVGAGAEHLSFAHLQSGYWSPKRFVALGPRIEASVPVPKVKGLDAAFGLNLSRFQEESLPWGSGYYGSFKLAYGSRNGLLIEGSYTLGRSKQRTSTWADDHLSLTVASVF